MTFDHVTASTTVSSTTTSAGRKRKNYDTMTINSDCDDIAAAVGGGLSEVPSTNGNHNKNTDDNNFNAVSSSESTTVTTNTTNKLSQISRQSQQQNRRDSRSTPAVPWFILKATAIASLGGILFGYDMGVIACALPSLSRDFALSDLQQERVVGLLYAGGAFGAAAGGSICDAWGRRAAILVTDALFVGGSILLFLAPSVRAIGIGRVVVGCAISVSGIADVAYLHEMAPRQWRGSIVSVNEACISLGFLLAFLCGWWLEDYPSGWRYLFGISGWLALIQGIGMCWTMPESPVWLKQQGRLRDRQQALRIIYGNDEEGMMKEEDYAAGEECSATATTAATEAIETLPKGDGILRTSSAASLSGPRLSSLSYDNLNKASTSAPAATITTTTTSPFRDRLRHVHGVVLRHKHQAWIAIFLAVTQQLSGQAAVLNYAPLIFNKLNHSSLFATLWIGVVKFTVTVIVIWKIEFMGRKFLLLFGMLMIVIGQYIVAFAFSRSSSDNAHVNEDDAAAGDSAPSDAAMFWALPGILLVTLGYSCSFGPLTWLLTSELFPTNIRGRALGASTIVTYLFASLVTSTFLSLQTKWGDSTVFVAYGTVTLLGMIFVQLAVPDTGNKTAEQVDAAVKEMWWWRRRSRKRGTLIPNVDETEAEHAGSSSISPMPRYVTEMT